MWKRIYEIQDGHQSGRWQWQFTWADGRVEVYPERWMFFDAICVPPGIGKCITNVDEARIEAERQADCFARRK